MLDEKPWYCMKYQIYQKISEISSNYMTNLHFLIDCYTAKKIWKFHSTAFAQRNDQIIGFSIKMTNKPDKALQRFHFNTRVNVLCK